MNISNQDIDAFCAQRGFTLIEIMIALTVSLVLMVGVGQLFVGSREGYRLQSGMARLQENSRFALEQLRRDIGNTGYPRGELANLFDPATSDGGGNAPDTISVVFQSATDCLGQATPVISGAQTAINTYSIADPDGDGIFSLMCTGNGAAAAQSLVDGVDNMQVLYGMDTDADGIANQYLSAANAALVLNSVVSVRIGLLVNSIDNVASKDVTNTYALLDAPVITVTDRRQRQVYSTTIAIRNPIS